MSLMDVDFAMSFVQRNMGNEVDIVLAVCVNLVRIAFDSAPLMAASVLIRDKLL